MNTSTCSINAYTVVRKGCSFKFQVLGDDLEITLGGNDRPLALLFDTEAFRLFLEQGGQAIRSMNATHASEQAESD